VYTGNEPKDREAKVYTENDSHFPYQTPFDMSESKQAPHPKDEDKPKMDHFFDYIHQDA
jgi:hypothetical protein